MGGLIPERILKEIAYRIDIADLIGSRVTLQRAGSALKALCPFHKEKTPSFHVNPQRQTFHCFGCGAHGDVFRFLMMMDGLDFGAAARELARRANVELEYESDDSAARRRRELFVVLGAVAAKYRSTLLKGAGADAARAYLASRALAPETAEAFQVGYAPDEWDSVLKWGQAKGYAPDLLVEVGLVVEQREGDTRRHYDRFRNRLMFPIRDPQGRVVGFSGRVLAPETREAKYVNSPETPVFQKGRILYGMDRARPHILKTREALICEGQIDVIRCHQCGFVNAVAAQGTAFTPDHAGLVRRSADGAVLVFDGDEAGRQAVVKTARLLVAEGLAVRVAALPAGEDPDSLLRARGAEAFRAVLQAAVSIVAFQAALCRPDGAPLAEAAALRAARELLRTIAGCPSALQRAGMLAEAAERLGLPLQALEEELRSPALRPARAAADARAGEARDRAAAEGAAIPREERALCECLVQGFHQPAVRDVAAGRLRPDLFLDPLCRAAAALVLESWKAGVALDDVVEDADAGAPGLAAFVTQLTAAPEKSGRGEFGPDEAVKTLLLALWRKAVARERAALPAADEERRTQLTYDLKALQSWSEGRAIIAIEMGE
jgi:DNA primase